VIAVLPFTNLGRDAETDLIVDGFTAEVLHQLAIIDGLHVKSWESSVALRDRPLAELRDRLGVNLVLQGQVLWADRRVRITAQLVDVARDVPLWSDRFDRDVADVFAVQDEIARAIVNRLRLKLDAGQRRYDANPQAYEMYLKARALTNRGGPEDPAAAVDLFTRVIATDEAFAPAHAGLANAYGWLSMFPLQTVSLANALVIMRSSTARALELDPRLAEAHAAMGWVLSRERDWRGAGESFEHAITLDPSLVSTYIGYSFSTLKPQERYADAERVLQSALTRDPLSLEVAREMAQLYHVTGRFDEAIALLERLAAQDGRLPLVRRELGRALTFAGRPAEAIPIFEEPPSLSLHYLAHAYVRAGRRADAERLFAEHRAVANRAAVIAAALGDVDGTFEALERMMADEPHRVAQHLIQPEFALLRGNPRRAALRRALGLER
jgi:serine/threonine-protein kinase